MSIVSRCFFLDHAAGTRIALEQFKEHAYGSKVSERSRYENSETERVCRCARLRSRIGLSFHARAGNSPGTAQDHLQPVHDDKTPLLGSLARRASSSATG